MRAPTRSREGGFALAAALFVLGLLALLALQVALAARVERRLAWNLSTAARARAAAQGGLAHALLRLRALQERSVGPEGSDPRLLDEWNRVDRLGDSLGVVELPGGGRYRVRLTDVASRLPLNQATGEELRRLFRAYGAGEEEARLAALAVVDHRARNGPLGAVGELFRLDPLARVPRRVEESLTVLGAGRVNLNTAPLPVLRALPGMTEEAVEWVLARQRAGRSVRSLLEMAPELGEAARGELQRHFALLAGRTVFEPSLVEIATEGWVADDGVQLEIVSVGARMGPSIQLLTSVER